MSLKKIEGDYEKPTWTQGFKNEPKNTFPLFRIGELPSLKPDAPIVSYDKPNPVITVIEPKELFPEKDASVFPNLLPHIELKSVKPILSLPEKEHPSILPDYLSLSGKRNKFIFERPEDDPKTFK